MESEFVTIVLPLPAKVLQPNCTIGSLGGRHMKASATKRYRQLAKDAIEAEQIDTAPWERVEVGIVFYHSTTRRRDQDNAMGSLKSAYDGIVDAGLVVDDDYDHMRRTSPSFLHDKDYPRVEITITRIN